MCFSYNLLFKRGGILLFFLLYSLSCFALKGGRVELMHAIKEVVLNDLELNKNDTTLINDIESLANQKDIDELNFIKQINAIGGKLHKQGNIVSVIRFYIFVISYYDHMPKLSFEEVEAMIQLYIPVGAAHEESGMWSSAMDYYMKGLSLAEEHGFDNCKAMLYNNIGGIYYKRNEFKKAEAYMLRALEINRKNGADKELVNNYNNLAGICVSLGKLDLALDYVLKALLLLDSEKDARSYYFLQCSIGNLYNIKGDYSLALSYLTNAMNNQRNLNFTSDLVQTYNILVDVYAAMGVRDSVGSYLNKSLELVKATGNEHIESLLLYKMAAFYKDKGEYKKAFQALEKSTLLNDSIIQADNLKKMSTMDLLYESNKKARDNEVLLREVTLRKIASDRLWIITACVVVLLIVTVVFLINLSKNKERKNRLQEKIVEQQSLQFEKEKVLQKQKELELARMLDQRNRELTSYTLHLLKNNEFISDLNEELKQLLLELNPKDKLHREHLRQIISKLHCQSSTNDWDEFRYYFEQVHPSFYDKLEKSYPDLTSKDKRLCAFVCLGFSSKEISAITFKEVRSIESARNRLRKKLNIPTTEDLKDFLHGFIDYS